MSLFLAAGLLIALTAAIRGLWSPCGLSMISTITPMTEQARGNRFPVTATWFVLGATLGGATLGAVAAAGAAFVSALGASVTLRVAILCGGALVTIASDIHLLGWSLWNHPRQVDETWLGRMRAWAYAAGFGWQIGTGVATYIMTAGVYLLIATAMVSGSPLAAFLLCAAFGFFRGFCVWSAGGVHTHADLQNLHRRIERGEPASRVLAVTGQLGALFLLATALPVPAAVVFTVVGSALTVWGASTQRTVACATGASPTRASLPTISGGA